MVHADDVRPHECRHDNRQDRNRDDPETGNPLIRLGEWMWGEHVHNVGMAVIDRPHVFKVHALAELRFIFLWRDREKLTKYPVSNVSGKNTTVHNVKRRLCGR